MRVRNWQRGSGKDAEGSADQVRIRPPVEESTGTALTEQPVLSARRWVLTMLALAGVSLMAIVLVYRIAATYGRLPIHTLLLAGVILNAILSALIMFITSIMDPNRSFSVMFWLMGTLAAPDYPAMAVLLLYLIVGGSILLWQTPSLNLLTLGEESARSLGVEVETVKRTVFFTSALLTGAVVSVSGMIGFVGMVIPHAVRMVIGADHRLLLPASALVGGTFLVAADTVARTVLAPAEIRVGIVTALGGGPLFIYLLAYRKSGLAVWGRARVRRAGQRTESGGSASDTS